MPSLLSLLAPLLPRLLLGAILAPPTLPEARPWWIAASVACESARLVLALAATDALDGVAAVLDMLMFAGVYGSWAVIVTCVLSAPPSRGANGGIEADDKVTAVVAAVAKARSDDRQRGIVSTSSSVSTNLSSLCSRSTASGDDRDNDFEQVHNRITSDLDILNLAPSTPRPTPQLATSPSLTDTSSTDSVPLSPGGWIASAHHLAAAALLTSDSTSTDSGAEGLRRHKMGDSAPQEPTATTSASLSRALRSAASSLASFASASNLLLHLPGADDAGAGDDAHTDHDGGGGGTAARLAAGRVHTAADEAEVDVDPCRLPLLASRSWMLAADDDELLTPKLGDEQKGGGDDVGSVGELGCDNVRAMGSFGRKQGNANEGEECQGFQL